jgi:membrane protein involved in colicin uptake
LYLINIKGMDVGFTLFGSARTIRLQAREAVKFDLPEDVDRKASALRYYKQLQALGVGLTTQEPEGYKIKAVVEQSKAPKVDGAGKDDEAKKKAAADAAAKKKADDEAAAKKKADEEAAAKAKAEAEAVAKAKADEIEAAKKKQEEEDAAKAAAGEGGTPDGTAGAGDNTPPAEDKKDAKNAKK